MYNFVNRKLPAPLLDMFDYQADDYTYNTRHLKDKRSKNSRRTYFETASYIDTDKGPHDWLNLDADVKAATSKQAFRHQFQRLKFTSY